MITRRNHFLNEKLHIILRITKIIVLLKKSNCVLIINIACHNVHWNICFRFVRHIHQVAEKLFKQIKFPVHANI